MGVDTARRHSLATRLLISSVVVGAIAVAATAWLTVHTTTEELQVQQGQVLTNDTRIYDTLLTYAATHPTWKTVTPVVNHLAALTGRRIVVVAGDLRVDTARTALPPPTGVSTVIDPLAVDTTLTSDATPDRIATAAVGPFRLDAHARRALTLIADETVRCYTKVGNRDIHVVVAPTGRPYLDGTLSHDQGCPIKSLVAPTAGEARAAAQLQRLMRRCLASSSLHDYTLRLGWQFGIGQTLYLSNGRQDYPDYIAAPVRLRTCVTTARREQLAPYVAAPAQLYVTDANGQRTTTARLGSVSLLKVGLAGGLVLLVATFITALNASRLSRPLRQLTAAAQRMRDGDVTARVRVGRRRDEVSQLAGAFNDMSRSREEAEQVRRTMVADIAHELRSPLSNIRGWLEAIQDDVAEPTPELISSLAGQAVQLQHVVDDLQDLAMADVGKLALHRVPVSVSELVEQVRSAHGAEAVATGVDLHVQIASDLTIASGDPVRLSQALGNIVGNAIRYTPPGGTVTITAHEDGPNAALDVIDTGVGIAAADLPHVFDRFWRADPSRARSSGGSGLGLAIAKRLAQSHGGDVSVTSTPGVGSTFTLLIPTGSGDVE